MLLFIAAIMVTIWLGGYGMLLGFGICGRPLALCGYRPVAWFGLAMVVVALSVGSAFVLTRGIGTVQNMVRATMLETQGKAVAAALRLKTRLPVQLDEALRLDDIRAEHDEIIYRIAVIATNDQTFRAIFNDVQDTMRRTGCGRDDYRAMLKFGFTVALQFYPAGGSTTDQVVLTPAGCGMKP